MSTARHPLPALSRLTERIATAVVVIAGSSVAVPWLDGYGPVKVRAAAAVLVAVLGVAAIVFSLLRPPLRAVPRREIFLRATSVVLTGLLVVGIFYRLDHGPMRLIGSPGAALLGIVVIVGLGSAMAEVLVLLSRGAHRWHARGGRWRWRRRIPWWGFAIALAVLWAPALITLAPGSVTYDGMRQLDELFGVRISHLDFQYTPTNHHPWFATVWQGTLVKAGMAVTHGSINGGLLFHSAVLVVLSLLSYGVLIYRVQSLAGTGWALVALAYFGVVPHFANYAMLYEKTGWYQLAIIWFYLGVASFVLRSSSLSTSLIMLGLGGFLTAMFRSNGIYIVAASLAILAIAELIRRQRRQALAVAVALVVIVGAFAGWNSIVLPRLGVEPASPGEALVIPFQQLGRIVKEDGDDITPTQRAAINEIMPYDQIASSYNPESGDGVKGIYEIDTFLITDSGIQKMEKNPDWWHSTAYQKHLIDFAGVWVQLVIAHPLTALSATVDNTYLYYTPSLDRGDDISLFTGGLPDYDVLANQYTPDYRHVAGEAPVGVLQSYYSAWAALPGLELLSNPGIYGWTVIGLGISLLFWRRHQRVLLFVPVALVYLINFAGARNGDFRYTVALLPLIVLCLAAWWTRPASTAAGDLVEGHTAVPEDLLESDG